MLDWCQLAEEEKERIISEVSFEKLLLAGESVHQLPANAPPSLVSSVKKWDLKPPYFVGNEEIWAVYFRLRCLAEIKDQHERKARTIEEPEGHWTTPSIAKLIRGGLAKALSCASLSKHFPWSPQNHLAWPLSFRAEVQSALIFS